MVRFGLTPFASQHGGVPFEAFVNANAGASISTEASVEFFADTDIAGTASFVGTGRADLFISSDPVNASALVVIDAKYQGNGIIGVSSSANAAAIAFKETLTSTSVAATASVLSTGVITQFGLVDMDANASVSDLEASALYHVYSGVNASANTLNLEASADYQAYVNSNGVASTLGLASANRFGIVDMLADAETLIDGGFIIKSAVVLINATASFTGQYVINLQALAPDIRRLLVDRGYRILFINQDNRDVFVSGDGVDLYIGRDGRNVS